MSVLRKSTGRSFQIVGSETRKLRQPKRDSTRRTTRSPWSAVWLHWLYTIFLYYILIKELLTYLLVQLHQQLEKLPSSLWRPQCMQKPAVILWISLCPCLCHPLLVAMRILSSMAPWGKILSSLSQMDWWQNRFTCCLQISRKSAAEKWQFGGIVSLTSKSYFFSEQFWTKAPKVFREAFHLSLYHCVKFRLDRFRIARVI